MATYYVIERQKYMHGDVYIIPYMNTCKMKVCAKSRLLFRRRSQYGFSYEVLSKTQTIRRFGNKWFQKQMQDYPRNQIDIYKKYQWGNDS